MRQTISIWWMSTLVLWATLQVRATVTGSVSCNTYMCITVKHDSTEQLDQYTLEPPSGESIALDDFGWIAIGFGTSMSNTPMVITWPNSDGSITLSQREASSHVMPTVDSSPSRTASLSSVLSYSNSSTTSITFTLPSNSSASSNTTNLIWAYGSTNPDDSSDDATIKQHKASGDTEVYLLGTLSDSANSTIVAGNATSSTSSSNSTSSDNSSSSTSNVLIAHVVCGAVATMAIFPSGVLVPRLARIFTMKRWWFPVHGALNGIIGFVLVVAAFGIAKANFDGGYDTAHRKLGLTLFILCIFQTLLGLFTHYHAPTHTHRFQTSSGRGPFHFLHIALGLLILGLGWATTWKGMNDEWPYWQGTSVSVGWKVGWGLIVAVVSVSYLIGIYLLPRQLANERQRLRWAATLGHPQPAPPPVRKSRLWGKERTGASAGVNPDGLGYGFANGYGSKHSIAEGGDDASGGGFPLDRLPPPPPPLHDSGRPPRRLPPPPPIPPRP